jgi:hypothetical protein
MAMIHHGTETYPEAVSKAAKHFRVKLDEMFHASHDRVTSVIEQVERDVPEDAVVAGRALKFHADGPIQRPLTISYPGDERALMSIHDHALTQLAYKAKINNLAPVVKDLMTRGQWGQELIAHNLNEVFSHMNGDRFLLRSVRGELRGFLSDQYRRLDSRPLLDAFVGTMKKYGARPTDGFALQTKIKMRCFLPMVFEPFPGEIMAFGAELSDSDYGDGALRLSGIVLRMYCTNLACLEDVIHQVHLGKRLPDNVRFSEQTLQLDTQAMASAIGDMAGSVLGPAAVDDYCSLVRSANEEKVEPGAITAWVKKNLSKGEGEKLVEKFSSPDVELLPPGQTRWRWSNALSWLANETPDERRKLDLQDFAGTIARTQVKVA